MSQRFHLPHFAHDHPAVVNANEAQAALASLGDRVADWVATTVGSWPFVIVQSLFLAFWIAANVVALVRHWDPYPFILLNLVLSFQAAYTAPIIMMSQNRADAKDRLRAELDYQVNIKAEEETKAVLERIEAATDAILHLMEKVEAQEAVLRRLVAEWPDKPV
ncbi:MAG TPA: DUF1003 domain-containing protein [Firmicutes bacterium]|nr:DUF1003 domain-containing protein [Bacillota bacterium]